MVLSSRNAKKGDVIIALGQIGVITLTLYNTTTPKKVKGRPCDSAVIIFSTDSSRSIRNTGRYRMCPRTVNNALVGLYLYCCTSKKRDVLYLLAAIVYLVSLLFCRPPHNKKTPLFHNFLSNNRSLAHQKRTRDFLDLSLKE